MSKQTNECEGKHPYKTAEDCAGVLKHRNKRGTCKVKCYKCSACHFWHIGHEKRTRTAPYVRIQSKPDYVHVPKVHVVKRNIK